MKRRPPPTTEHGAFQAAIQAAPYDEGAWLMFIDWLKDQARNREACIADIAWRQRKKFGPLTVAECKLSVSEFDAKDRFACTLVNLFQRQCSDPITRLGRYRGLCRYETRVNPTTKLPEWRVVGPDPAVRPLDCPPNDERRRFTQWKPYPDEWRVVWWVSPTLNCWEMVCRYPIERRLGVATGCTAHARDLSRLYSTVCVIRDQDGRFDRAFQDGYQVWTNPGVQPPEARLRVTLPEDEFSE